MAEDFFQDLPRIEMADLCFIKIAILPNFVSKIDTLRPEFSFLSSMSEYTQYYIDLEKTTSEKKKYSSPALLQDLGSLMPLRKRHTMNSFWKSIRLRYEREKQRGMQSEELFAFLPIKIKIPVEKISGIKKEYPVKLFAYLFPFGVCCINMQVTINNRSLRFDEFLDLVAHLKYKSAVKDGLQFEALAKQISRQINRGLFQGDPPDIISTSTHTLIFLKQTNPPLTYDPNLTGLESQRRGIAAILESRKDIQSVDNLDEIFSCKLKNLRKEEFLFFTTARTLIYPSPYWLNELENMAKQKLTLLSEDNAATKDLVTNFVSEKFDCMRDNYQSLLNVMFGTNRLLSEFLIPRKSTHDAQIIRQYENYFSKVFPNRDPKQAVPSYYQHAVEAIGGVVGLQNHLKDLKSN
jgi:hypothetical protein